MQRRLALSLRHIYLTEETPTRSVALCELSMLTVGCDQVYGSDGLACRELLKIADMMYKAQQNQQVGLPSHISGQDIH